MKRFFAARFSRGAIFLLPFLACAALASTRASAADTPSSVASQIERGRVLLGLGDARAAAVLQSAAQTSLDVLQAVSATDTATDFATPRDAASRVPWRRALLDALEAQRWLAQAQLAPATRDEETATATLALLLQLANLASENAPRATAKNADAKNADPNRDNQAASEASAQLLALLPDGAARATTATLQRLTRFFYESAPPQSEVLSLPENAPQHFVFFDAPLSPRGTNAAASTRSAPLYRAYVSAALPPSLQMDRAVFAYRATDETHWQLAARVFYAAPSRTQNARDDAPRARFLASRS